MKLIPRFERILVKPVDAKESTRNGLVIPETQRDKPQEGVVVAFADGADVFADINVGSRVLFGKYAGSEIALDGELHVIMKAEEILGVFE